ncbi:unnamed protein product [Clavelina lepadiformis]|uniref:Uncharacterized protein n=1 Tax=Clavelina lepadiformis TaxID=159417 RepID=A0ABP0H1Q0_CLALP
MEILYHIKEDMAIMGLGEEDAIDRVKQGIMESALVTQLNGKRAWRRRIAALIPLTGEWRKGGSKFLCVMRSVPDVPCGVGAHLRSKTDQS